MSIDIDAIEARANAATPGPWEWHGHPFQDVTGEGLETFYSVWVSGKPQLAAKGDAVEPVIGKRETMIFIAAARSDVPALCEYARAADARAERAEAALERARALLSEWREYANDPEELFQWTRFASVADELAALLAPAPGGAA